MCIRDRITIDNKCPSCGANVKFNPTTQKWDCEYCGNSYEIGEFEKQQEKETKENLDFEIDEYTCPNCGATVVTDANTVATHCVYCGNTTIMKNRLQGEFKPDKLIPFKTTKEEAIEEFKKNVKKFMNNKLALLGLLVIVIMTVACIIGAIAGVDYVTPHLPDMKKAPGNGYLFGTDTMGRDLFARVLIGGCYSILIGVFCAVLSSVIGAILGAIAGYFGGKTDAAIIRISEIFQAFPQLVLVMMLVAIVNKRGLGNLLFIFVFTGWMTTFRMVRNEFVSIKGETYVKVCEAFGMSRMNIMFKQILPNVMSPIIVSTTTNVAFFILQEAALSFIGLGVADSTPTWGNILNAAKSVSVVTNQWWIWVFPGLAITLFVLAINFLGDGIRDVMDAKQQ